MKGIYVLIFRIEKERSINVGKIGRFVFKPAYYAYVGSAMSGIQRLKRHLKNLKKGSVKNKHWHIDFIIPFCKSIGWVFAECSDPGKEEKLAIYLSKKLNYVEGFGASDSRAPSHLFKDINLNKLKSTVIKALKSIGAEKLQTNIDTENKKTQ